MPDNSSLGYWVRRFLMEYLVHERGLSRNTQQSYRDAFRLFLPYSSRQTRVAVDRLTIEDISPELVVAFLAHLEIDRASTAITRRASAGGRGLVHPDSQHPVQATRQEFCSLS
jgi:site-specific recombinase XerD